MDGFQLRRAAAIVWKDMLSEGRTKARFNAMAFFAILVLFIFSFAIGPDAPAVGAGRERLLEYVSPGLLWVAIVLTGVLALGRSFQMELEGGALESYWLYPGGRNALWVGKLVSNVLILLAMEALVIPFAGIIYSLDIWPRLPGLVGIAALATVGFAAVGTFYAALTVNIRAREVMLPLLLFPVLVPVLLAAVKGTALVVRGDPMGELGLWVRLLVIFDVVFLTVCSLTFEYVLED